MSHIHNTCVVVVAISFEQTDQNSVFTTLLGTVFVELLQEVFVALFGGGGVGFVLHLEHNRHNFYALLIEIFEDEIAFTARTRVVVFLEISSWKRRCSNFVELRLAVLL